MAVKANSRCKSHFRSQ